jgi:signal transduction histidine kinase
MFSLSALLFIVLLSIFFGGMVLNRDPRAKTNRLFLVWTILCAAWITASYCETSPFFSHARREFFLRLDFIIAIIGAAWLVVFVANFAYQRTKRWHDLAVIFPAVLLAGLSLTKEIIFNIRFDRLETLSFAEGPVFGIYGVSLVGYFAIALIALGIRYFDRRTKNRSQILTILVGLVLTLVMATTINLVFQNVLPAEIYRFGIYAFIFFVGSVAYAIVRHEFMRVRFLLVETMLLGILATLLAQVIVADNLTNALVALASFIVMLALGFFLVRSVFMEIKHREQLEQLTKELGAANKKLKELDDMKTTFLSIAAHQLRTPLAVTKGYLTSLQQGMFGRLTAKQGRALTTLSKSNEELISLINDLLDLSRIESGRLVTKIDKMDLVGAVSEIEEFFKPKAAEKKINFTVQKPVELWIKADTDKAKEVVKNLIDNAIKYTEKGGVAVALKAEGKFGVVSVKDTGYGLTSEDKKHLFEKFVSGSASKKVQVTSGFGLFVVKNLMEAMGGDISAQSPGAGRGTTFTARFPLTENN